MMKPFAAIVSAIIAVSVSGIASADTGPGTFTVTVTVTFRYDADRSVAESYASFANKATRICSTNEPKLLVIREREKARADDVMRQLVLKMGRPSIAALHREATGADVQVASGLVIK